ncbi:MAG: FtsX-like permease family protein [Ruminococcus sp.]|nr:FtsX-like permease family protein [Ruminococcus sp.]
MKRSKNIAVRNIAGKPLRSAVLVILAALLSLTVCAGTLIVRSLRSGLDSLEARLGADVMVVPKEASQKQSFENIVLQGSTGYFYMDKSLMDKVTGRDGVGKSSPQFFLASASAGCCSIPVQIIGFNPDTDFTITPWIKRSYGGELGLFDVVIGNDLNAFVGDSIKFYGVDCRVAAKLDKTGTNFDTAVFTNADTIKQLIRASLDLGMNSFESLDPDNSVSCVLINSDGTRSPEEIVNDINVHVKKVRAFRTGDMISGISSSLSGVSDVIGVMIAAVWLLGLVILLLAFTMSVNERKKEFAVLRAAGASRGKLASVVMQEAVITGLAGSIAGALLGIAAIVPFSKAIENALGLPFLTPDIASAAVPAVMSVLLSAAVCALAAAVSAVRISRIDTALILRGDN